MIDLILLLLWGLMVFFALRKGFFAVALQLAAWVVSLALAGVLSAALAQPLYQAFAQEPLRQIIASNLAQGIKGSEAAQAAQTMIAELPEALSRLAQAAGISLEALTESLKAQQFTAANAAQLLEETIVAPIAVAAIRIVLSLLLFALLLLGTRLLSGQIAKLTELPVLKQADRMLGAVLGVVKGALLVFILTLALRAAAALRLGGDAFVAATEQSYLIALLEWAHL